jgi:hypothetical protein
MALALARRQLDSLAHLLILLLLFALLSPSVQQTSPGLGGENPLPTRLSQAVVEGRQTAILLLMMARNEEENFSANLPKWRSVISAYTCAIDDRTNDATNVAIAEALPDHPLWVFYYHFQGFGEARTRMIREGWRKFGDSMTHFLVADPDWEAQGPMSLADLDLMHMAFQFKIFDRNAHTTRLSEWLLLAQSGLSFKYSLHEQLMVPPLPMSQSRIIPWVVREVEVKGRNSWHQQVNHGNSMSFNRYLFDLQLLHEDIETLEDDPHVLYYLGATYFALLEAKVGAGEHAVTEEMGQWIERGVHFLSQRCGEHHLNNTKLPPEQSWAAMRWLAYAYQNFAPDFKKSVYWYRRCVDFDPPRADCPTFLSKLYRSNGHIDKAWESVVGALRSPMQERTFSNNFYIYHCSLPLESSLTLLELFQRGDGVDGSVIDPSRFPIFLFGWRLLRTAQLACNSSKHGFLLETNATVAAAEISYRALAPMDPSDPNGPSPLQVGPSVGSFLRESTHHR